LVGKPDHRTHDVKRFGTGRSEACREHGNSATVVSAHFQNTAAHVFADNAETLKVIKLGIDNKQVLASLNCYATRQTDSLV
jgi:hypothetical protein